MSYPIIVDAHLDIAYNAVAFQRDVRRGALATRAGEADTWMQKENGLATVGLPDLLRGRVGLVFGTLFVEPERRRMGPHGLTYRNEHEAHAQALQQLDFYRRLADREKIVRIVQNQADLTSVLDGWGVATMGPRRKGASASGGRPQIGVVLLMEGADPILEPREVERWVEYGVRIVGLAWAATRYAGGTGEPGGLTRMGEELLQEMARFGLVLDVSHLAHKALMEAIERYQGSHVIASHSNSHRITPTDRHLPDEAIQALAERGGVVGVVLYNRFLDPKWSRASAGGNKHDVTLDQVVRHIDYICQLTGSAEHAGIGSDFDGGFGSESIPAELDTARDLYKVGEALERHGYTRSHVEAIMGGNWLRVLRGALPD